MKKRQAKKCDRNMLLLQGMSYREKRKYDRNYQKHLTERNHKRKFFKGFDEIEELLMEAGLYTPEEIKASYGPCKTNNRWRQRRKLGAEIIG